MWRQAKVPIKHRLKAKRSIGESALRCNANDLTQALSRRCTKGDPGQPHPLGRPGVLCARERLGPIEIDCHAQKGECQQEKRNYQTLQRPAHRSLPASVLRTPGLTHRYVLWHFPTPPLKPVRCSWSWKSRQRAKGPCRPPAVQHPDSPKLAEGQSGQQELITSVAFRVRILRSNKRSALRRPRGSQGWERRTHGLFKTDTCRTCTRRPLSIDSQAGGERSSRCSGQLGRQWKVSVSSKSVGWRQVGQMAVSSPPLRLAILEGPSGRLILAHRSYFEPRLLHLLKLGRPQGQAGERRPKIQLWRWRDGPLRLRKTAWRGNFERQHEFISRLTTWAVPPPWSLPWRSKNVRPQFRKCPFRFQFSAAAGLASVPLPSHR